MGLVLLTYALATPSVAVSQAISRTYVGVWKESHPRFTPQAHFDALPRGEADASSRLVCAVEPSSDTVYLSVSAPVQARYPFIALGFHWEGELPPGAQLALDARTSPDGQSWTEWLPTEMLDATRGDLDSRDTDLLFASGSYFQYRVAVAGLPEGVTPHLREVKVTTIDSSQGPRPREASLDAEPSRRLAALARPPVLSRSAWGADERYRYKQGALVWDPTRYEPAKKIIIHHTASQTNEPVDSAAAVRAIYYYHAVTRGWGDIGYNYLIDAAGRVYEGRTGGPNVVAAHAAASPSQNYNPGSIGVALLGNFNTGDPTPKAVEALGAFLIAKSVQHGIDPTGRGWFVDKDVPNILGHRDVVGTSCPGGRLYPQLSTLRQRARAGLPELGQAWLGHTTPKVLEPGVQVRVGLTVKNSGAAAWATTGPNLVRVGYSWALPDGTPYRAEPSLELHSDLPGTVAPGEQVIANVPLKTPSKPGVYLLRWDMVQERVSWFAEQGNEPLELRVLVAPWAVWPAHELVTLPNELLVLLPPETLRQLPLSRLTLLSNTELVQLIPDIVPLFPNERLLSFSNDIMLRYVPDDRLKTFSLDRIRTFPLEVQQRLGLAPRPSPTAEPSRAVTPAPSPTPAAASEPPAKAAPVPTATPAPAAAAPPEATPAAAPAPAPAVSPPPPPDSQTPDPGGTVAP